MPRKKRAGKGGRMGATQSGASGRGRGKGRGGGGMLSDGQPDAANFLPAIMDAALGCDDEEPQDDVGEGSGPSQNDGIDED